MNTKDALELLFKTFADYSFHHQFIIELGDLLKNVLKGKENQFFKCLITQLNYIKILGVAVHKANGHEIIRGFDGHYYLRLTRGNTVRTEEIFRPASLLSLRVRPVRVV